MEDEIKPGDPLYERFHKALDNVQARQALHELQRRHPEWKDESIDWETVVSVADGNHDPAA